MEAQGRSTTPDGVTPLEQQVLDEYATLAANLEHLATLLGALAESPSAEILDRLRGLERKTSLVFTLLKASVYSIVLQQRIEDEEGLPPTAEDGEWPEWPE